MADKPHTPLLWSTMPPDRARRLERLMMERSVNKVNQSSLDEPPLVMPPLVGISEAEARALEEDPLEPAAPGETLSHMYARVLEWERRHSDVLLESSDWRCIPGSEPGSKERIRKIN